MTYMYMPRGTLARMSREKNLVSDMLLLEHKPNGYTEDELTSVRVVTLREYAHELATKEAVFHQLPHKGRYDIGLEGASDIVDTILKGKYDIMKEFVHVQPDGEILIAVNSITIDDAAVSYGLNLLFNMDSVAPGAFQHFGDAIPLNWS